MRRRWLMLALLMGGCGDDGAPGLTSRFVLPADPAAAIPIADIPWPNDTHRGPDRRYLVTPETVALPAQADARVVHGIAAGLSERDCVGITSGAVFPLDNADPTDPLVVSPDDVAIVDLRNGRTFPAEVHVRPLEGQLFVRPAGNVLLMDRTYGVLVFKGVATASGVPLEAPPALTRVLSSNDGPERAVKGYEWVRSYLQIEGIDPAEVVAATAFTTCNVRPPFQAIADQLDAAPPPVAAIDAVIPAGAEMDALLGVPDDNTYPGLDNPGGIAHASLGWVVLGHFDTPNYQSATPGQPGRFDYDANGVPVVKGTEAVPFLLTLPAGLDSYTDVPVVIFQHGLNNSRTQVLEVANSLAARGFAVIGIDIPFHGERFPSAADRRSNFHDGTEPDGLADPSGPTAATYLFNIQGGNDEWLDPRVIQASFGQAIVEMMALGPLLTDGDWSTLRTATGLSDLSFSSRIVFSGESFGAILGVSAVVYQNRFEATFVTHAGGGLLNTLLVSSPDYGGLFLPILGGALAVGPGEIDPAFDPPYTHLAFQQFGPLLDSGDPVAHAQGFATGPIAIVTAYADEAVPNQATQLLARSIGLPWVEVGASSDGPRFVELARDTAPVQGNFGDATAAFIEITPATHGMITRRHGERSYQPDFPPATPLPEPIQVENPIVELQTMLGDFADSYVQEGRPRVTDPFAAP